MIRVLLVDDHELVRSGIAHLLSKHEAIHVVGAACSGEEAIRMVDDLKPEVVLMDISMPGIGGIEASRKINMKHPEVKLIALSALSDGPLPQQLLSAGAQGYISKSCSVTELIHAIMLVHGGRRYLSADVANELALSHLAGAATGSPFEQLTQREMQIVLLTMQGKGPSEIADLLKISRKTVSTYRFRVDSKLGVKNDVELFRLCMKHNLLTQSV
jgi:two-component system, NarL family, invasion response regulator UvrY